MSLKFRDVSEWGNRVYSIYVKQYADTVCTAKINHTLHSNKHTILIENIHAVKLIILWKVTMREKSVLWPHKFPWNSSYVTYIFRVWIIFYKIQLIKTCDICTLILIY